VSGIQAVASAVPGTVPGPVGTPRSCAWVGRPRTVSASATAAG